jgi:hypothetical protein
MNYDVPGFDYEALYQDRRKELEARKARESGISC